MVKYRNRVLQSSQKEKTVYRRLFILCLLFTLIFPVTAQDATVTRIATNLQNPRGVAVMPDGRLILVEAGTGFESIDPLDDSGKLSILEDVNGDGDFMDEGEITRIFSHLPSYNALTTYGTQRDEVGGAGDVVLLDDGRIFFTYDDPFELEAVVEVSPQGRNVGNLIVRDATMNALVYDAKLDYFYILESGWNRLILVNADREVFTVAEFPSLANDQQPVPAGLALDSTTGDLLVALFSGQVNNYYDNILSFMPGDAKVVRVNPLTGHITDEIIGLTTAVDVAIDELGNIFVVEMTTTWASALVPRQFDLHDPDSPPDAGGYVRFTGRVTMYPADTSAPIILADQLDTPTNITYHDHALYVSTGQGTPGRNIIGPTGITQIVGEIVKITNYLP